MPGKGNKKKYPQIKPSYESRSTRGLFVLGTASHSVDFRKSAGGFIHGFRYTSEYWGVEKGQRWELFPPSKEEFIAYWWEEITLSLVLAVGTTNTAKLQLRCLKWRRSDLGLYLKFLVVCLCFVLCLSCPLSLIYVTQ